MIDGKKAMQDLETANTKDQIARWAQQYALDLLDENERLLKVVEAARKYRCMSRSEGPGAILWQAGSELDAALESLGV